MKSTRPRNYAEIMAVIYRRRVRKELALARQVRGWGLHITMRFHLRLARAWRALAAGWTRHARMRTQ